MPLAISPEEIISGGLAPIQQAISSYGQGKTELARLKYLNAIKESQDANAFARQAQEARALLALHTAANQAAMERQAKYQADREDTRSKAMADREDARQAAMDARQEAMLKAQADRQRAEEADRVSRLSAEEKQRQIREIIVKSKYALPARVAGQSDEDYLTALMDAKRKREDADTAAGANAIIALNNETDRILNPELDPAKAEVIDAQLRLRLPSAFMALVDGSYPDKSKTVRKNLSAGMPIETAALAAGLGPQLASLKISTKSQIAQSTATPEEKMRLAQIGRSILDIQNGNPEIAQRAAMVAANKILKPSNGAALGLPAPSAAGVGGVSPAAIIAPQVESQPLIPGTSAIGMNPLPIFAPQTIVPPQMPTQKSFGSRDAGVSGAINLFNPFSPNNVVNRVYGNAGNGLGMVNDFYLGSDLPDALVIPPAPAPEPPHRNALDILAPQL